MDLIKIEERDGAQFVNARELHETLGVGRDFSNWVKDRIEKYGFVVGIDFQTCSPDLASENHGGHNKIDYLISVNMAKELAMVENNEKGREIRQYLIKVETSWNSPEMVFARALQMANKVIDDTRKRLAGAENQLAIAAPKVAFYDQVADSKDAIDMRSAAATLNIPGLGRNKLFERLRELEIVDNENLPYRRFQDAGYFRVIITRFTDQFGETHTNTKTLVYPKGLDYIRKAVTK